jgi:hypothetical protein
LIDISAFPVTRVGADCPISLPKFFCAPQPVVYIGKEKPGKYYSRRIGEVKTKMAQNSCPFLEQGIRAREGPLGKRLVDALARCARAFSLNRKFFIEAEPELAG